MDYTLHIEAHLHRGNRALNGLPDDFRYSFVHLRRMFREVLDRNSRVHPCIKGELLLKLYFGDVEGARDVEGANAVDPARNATKLCVLVEDIFTHIKTNGSSEWFNDALHYSEYADAISLRNYLQEYTTEPADFRNMSYLFEHGGECSIEELINCINLGDGTTIELPNNMLILHVSNFNYDRNAFPPYGDIEGHWYLLCYSRNDNESRFLSFITNHWREIVYHLSKCDFAYLNYVPPCDY